MNHLAAVFRNFMLVLVAFCSGRTDSFASWLELEVQIASDGTYDITAEVSQADNLGLSSLLVEVSNIDSIRSVAPRAISSDGVARGFWFDLTIPQSTVGADGQYVASHAPFATGDEFLWRVGQIAGGFDVIAGTERSVPWDVPTRMFTGDWSAGFLPSLRRADARLFDDWERPDETRTNYFFDGQPIDRPEPRPLEPIPIEPPPVPGSDLETLLELRVFPDGRFQVYAEALPGDHRGISTISLDLEHVGDGEIAAPWGIDSATGRQLGFTTRQAISLGEPDWSFIAGQNSSNLEELLLDVGVVAGSFDAVPGAAINVPWDAAVLVAEGTWDPTADDLPAFLGDPQVLLLLEDPEFATFSEVSTKVRVVRTLVATIPEPTSVLIVVFLVVACPRAGRIARG